MAFKNKALNKILSDQYYGKEPITFECTTYNMLNAYKWYNYVLSPESAREFLVSYLIENDRKAEARVLNNLKICWIPTTAAWTARIITNGNVVADHSLAFMNKKIMEAIGHKTEDDTSAAEKPNVQTYINDKSNDVIANIEDMIDTGFDMSFSYYNYFKANEISANILRKVKEYYFPLLQEYMDISKDSDLKEAYAYLKTKDVNKRILYFDKMMTDIDLLIANKNQARKKRVVVNTKVKKVNLLNFQYMKEDDTNKLVSIDPRKIIDAKEVWLYNTKLNTLSVLYSEVGFSIKGTTIQNISDKSVSKKIGRSVEKVLTRVKSETRVQLRKLMGDIKSVASEGSGRTNENVIIMRAF